MKDCRKPVPNSLKRAAYELLALVCGLLGVYLVFCLARVSPASQKGCELVIPQLRQLATVDDVRLAETLNHSTGRIPAGEFLMGSNTGREDESPQHPVYLDAFEIDCFEVTNAQFRLFLRATNRLSPPYWTGQDYPAGQAGYPVVGVPWDDADAFCNWVGKRLPTEAEWEKAARGLDGRIYPWGNNWDPSRANVYLSSVSPATALSAGFSQSTWEQAWEFLRMTSTQPGLPALKPVGSYPKGESPFGMMDMAGNASEWVADWYNWSDYAGLPARNPRVLEPQWNHGVRGSPWYDPAGNVAWIQMMSRVSARSSSHQSHDPRIGFRCARSLSGEILPSSGR